MSWLARRAWECCPALLLCSIASCDSTTSSEPPASALQDAAADTLGQEASTDAAVDQASGQDASAEAGSVEEITNTCLTKSQDEGHCKDCCDCAPFGCMELTPCRNACKEYDFSKNTEFIDVPIPSDLGKDGDYSECVKNNTSEQSCKECCECQMGLACGDFQFCRTLCDNSYGSFKLGGPTLVKDGFSFTEGPVWSTQKKVLLFSDIEGDTIFQLTPPDQVAAFLTPSHNANGLALDGNGRLLSAERGSRSLVRTLADGTRETVVSQYQGKPLNSPNDVAVRADGTIYFTDPTFGLQGAPSDLGFQGLYRVSAQGAVSLEAQSDGSPNGVAISPDEKTLYVAVTFENKILAFDLAADGATSNSRVFASVEEPDGICVASSGRLFVAAKDAGVGALVAVDDAGAVLAKVPIAAGPTNCEIGGDSGMTMFVTARKALYRIEAPVGGF